jgi:F-type H+-transporting ATPase subunit alpha
MTDAEHALREAAVDISAEVRERLDTADKLSDEDRDTIIEIARKALEAFQPKPKQNQETKEDATPKAKPKLKSDAEAKLDEPQPDSKTEEDAQLKAQAEPQSKPEARPDETKAEPKPKASPKEKS